MFDICNYYEQLVYDHLWHLKEISPEPLSQSFLMDVACIALNSLPNCYVCNLVDKGANLTESEHQDMRNDAVKAIERAILIVSENPHETRDQ
ncbi:late competence development ComFB family protein [Methylomonas sp. SURF-2]|uniref:Late competence development ComFB family protein n=1 Tax=Methylomonas subterranea TaxID=2952225 RepID=A0ABT1TG81_9GAMM|nr:late competence development ComFB family protein [Methylomonas sp. SURF-2]MCQ8104467.1 late competence development ComFB family protein [Methylomonas sp. SURF-2]